MSHVDRVLQISESLYPVDGSDDSVRAAFHLPAAGHDPGCGALAIPIDALLKVAIGAYCIQDCG
jgi:hypothetical protein